MLQYRQCHIVAALAGAILALAGCDRSGPTEMPLLSAPNQEPARGYSYTIIDAPGGTATQIHKMNARGDVVGMFTDSRGTHGFLIEDGTFQAIDFPGATNTFARGINGSGEIVGTYQTGGKPHGFLRTRQGLTTFDVPSANATRLWDINDPGELLGEYQAVSGGAWRAFTWHNGVLTNIDVADANMSAGYGINNHGEVVGHFTVPGNTKMFGFKIGPGTFVQFDHPESGTRMSCAQGIGIHGEVVGHYQDPVSKLVYGYLWRDDRFVETLMVTGAVETYPTAVTPSGVIAGYYLDGTRAVHAFIAVPPSHPWGPQW
jgi:uncharacterized membrane protein